MSQPDHEAILDQIRASKIEVPPELRARVLGISQTAGSTRLSRARKRLEETMTDDRR